MQHTGLIKLASRRSLLLDLGLNFVTLQSTKGHKQSIGKIQRLVREGKGAPTSLAFNLPVPLVSKTLNASISSCSAPEFCKEHGHSP
eukprot:1137503-Pelagomonas_calceolata.AAC.8